MNSFSWSLEKIRSNLRNLQKEKNIQSTLNLELDLILNNQDLKGQESLDIEDLKEFIEFYKSKIPDLKKKVCTMIFELIRKGGRVDIILNYLKMIQRDKGIDESKIPSLDEISGDLISGLRELIKFNEELMLTAAYTTDRSILFDFITSNEFQQEKIVFNKNELKSAELFNKKKKKSNQHSSRK